MSFSPLIIRGIASVFLRSNGIDFEKAQAIWDDPDYLEIPAKTSDEPPWLVIGKIGGSCWSAVITYRGDNIRILSVRRSREEEIELYESPGI